MAKPKFMYCSELLNENNSYDAIKQETTEIGKDQLTFLNPRTVKQPVLSVEVTPWKSEWTLHERHESMAAAEAIHKHNDMMQTLMATSASFYADSDNTLNNVHEHTDFV